MPKNIVTDAQKKVQKRNKHNKNNRKMNLVTLQKFLTTLEDLNASGLLEYDAEDDKYLIVRDENLKSKALPDGYDVEDITYSIKQIYEFHVKGLMKVSNRHTPSQIISINKDLLAQHFPQVPLHINDDDLKPFTRPVNEDLTPKILAEQKQTLFELLAPFIKKQPFTSKCQRKTFRPLTNERSKVNDDFFLWLKGSSQKKSYHNNRVLYKSFIFKDPEDPGVIWAYNVDYNRARDSLYKKITNYLISANGDTIPPYPDYLTHQLFTPIQFLPPLDKKRSLCRINLGLLKRYKHLLLNDALWKELQNVPDCPLGAGPLLKTVMQRYKKRGSDFTLQYSRYLTLKIFVEGIEKYGYIYDKNHFYISNYNIINLRNDLKKQGIEMQSLPTSIDAVINTELENKQKTLTNATDYVGRLIDRKRLAQVLKMPNIKLALNDKKIPHIESIDKTVQRKTQQQKNRTPRKYIHLETQKDNLALNVTHYPRRKRKHKYKEEHTPAISLPPPKDALPQEKDIVDTAELLALPIKVFRNADMADMEEPKADPAQFDLTNSEHQQLLQKRCQREIWFNEPLTNIVVEKIDAIDYPELGELNKPYGITATKLIDKGARIGGYYGDVITAKEAATTKNYQYMIEIPGGHCIIGKSPVSIANHSPTSANATLVYDEVLKEIQLIALRKIYPGEQVLVDYGCTEGFMERDKQDLKNNKELDESITRECYLNAHCNRKSFNYLLQEKKYQHIKWHEKLSKISHHFYGNKKFALYGSPLISAILNEDVNEVKRLLKQDPSLLHMPFIRVDSDGKAAPKYLQDSVYPLALAAYLGKLDIVLILLNLERSDANIRRTANGRVPLQDALQSESNEKLEVIKALLRFGALPTAQDAQDCTPLHYCAQHNLLAEHKVIIDHQETEESLKALVGCINKQNFDYLTTALAANNLTLLQDYVEKSNEIIQRKKVAEKENTSGSKKRKRTTPKKKVVNKVDPYEQLFYFTNNPTTEKSCLSKKEIEQLLNNVTALDTLLALINKQPSLFYQPFVALVEKKLRLATQSTLVTEPTITPQLQEEANTPVFMDIDDSSAHGEVTISDKSGEPPELNQAEVEKVNEQQQPNTDAGTDELLDALLAEQVAAPMETTDAFLIQSDTTAPERKDLRSESAEDFLKEAHRHFSHYLAKDPQESGYEPLRKALEAYRKAAELTPQQDHTRRSILLFIRQLESLQLHRQSEIYCKQYKWALGETRLDLDEELLKEMNAFLDSHAETKNVYYHLFRYFHQKAQMLIKEAGPDMHQTVSLLFQVITYLWKYQEALANGANLDEQTLAALKQFLLKQEYSGHYEFVLLDHLHNHIQDLFRQTALPEALSEANKMMQSFALIRHSKRKSEQPLEDPTLQKKAKTWKGWNESWLPLNKRGSLRTASSASAPGFFSSSSATTTNPSTATSKNPSTVL